MHDGHSYRERKEASVSNLVGTTMLELVLVSAPIILGLWLLAEAKALKSQGGLDGALSQSGWLCFIFEASVLLFPAMAPMLFPSHTTTLILSMAFANASCLVGRVFWKTSTLEARKQENAQQGWSAKVVTDDKRFAFSTMNVVTNFRASVMVMTCITILAVDFQVFPRRFAKTEVFGTGLMDLGVGATIFASGLASGCRFKRQRRESRPSLPTWYAILLDEASAAARGWPLAALGVSRLLVVKGLGYQEHVSEYGVHWNFFATLFCMRLIVAPMTRLRPRRMRLSLALLGVCVYQWLLLNGGLSDFIMHAPRDTIFAMNREGVLGIIGFVAIYYISEELGFQIRERSQKAEKEVEETLSSSSCLAITTMTNVVLWGLTLLSSCFIQETSRRMVNITYVLWVSAHSTLMLNLLMLVEGISLKPPRSQIMAAINTNMFPVFMVANLATGAINISIRTLDADTLTAVVIVSIYVISVAGFAIFLSYHGLMIRV